MTTKVKEILKLLEKLEEAEQEKALLFVKRMTGLHKQPGAILQLAGTIAKEDLKTMEGAIEKGCESIDEHEW